MRLDLDGLDGLVRPRDPRSPAGGPPSAATRRPAPPPPIPPPMLVLVPPPLAGAASATTPKPPARSGRSAALLALGGIGGIAALALGVLLLGPRPAADRQPEPSPPADRPTASAAARPAGPATVRSPDVPVQASRAERLAPDVNQPPTDTAAARPVLAAAASAPPASPRPIPPAPTAVAPSSTEGLEEDVRLPFHFPFNGVRPLRLSAGEDAELAALLHGLADRCGGAAVELTGHTDGMGSPRANRIVGLGRASVVRHLLEARPNPPPMDIASAGSSRPLASNQTRDGQDANRRVTAACAPPASPAKEFRP